MWTLFKPFFLNIILTLVTKGLRILCLWLSILGGVDVHFTQEPSDSSYFNNGTDANLVWDYTDPQNKVQSIIYSVLVNGAFVRMMVNSSHQVSKNILTFLHPTKDELKLKEKLPWLSRTSTLETITDLDVKWGEALLES